ncbi:MAG: winged helix-turn-helix domain-containing protein [Nitriliruptor sp.]|nr:MAG: winged helix-turn-helix domain-containing protein [Nitriliruptor sp.]
MRAFSPGQARRLSLRALGLADGRPPTGVRRDVRHLRSVTDRLGVIQLDSVNVLARAHELPFWSRLGSHDRAARDRWMWLSRELLEGWAHVASLTPADRWPLLAHRRAAFRHGPSRARFEASHPGVLDAVLAEVADTGPISVSDLSDPGRRTGPWWGDPRGKRALQQLFLGGELAVHDRTSQLVTIYDLSERVVPAVHRAQPPPPDDADRALLRHAVRAQGLGTAADLADHHRQPVRTAHRLLEDLVDRSEIARARVRGQDEVYYLDPEATVPRASRARTLVSPFDPVVWERGRTERLFGFHYRIEIYVPAAKRVHGYYVLPFLLGDRFVARVDLKADRASGRLLVRSAFAEVGIDRMAVATALAAELEELAAWLGLTSITIEDRGDLAGSLRRATG